MLSSSFAAALYLTQNPLPVGKKVFVIGHEGIGQELSVAGIPYIGVNDFNEKSIVLGSAGLRIDHFLLNSPLRCRLAAGGVDREVRGCDGASDHAPAWIVLKEQDGVGKKPKRRAILAA